MRALVLALCLAAGAATAAPPETSLRPVPRPDDAAERVAAAVAARSAPETPAAAAEAERVAEQVATQRQAQPVAVLRNLVGLSPRPPVRPENLRRRSIVQSVGLQIRPPGPVAGSICGVRAIKGEKLQPIAGRVSACGVAEPVRVTSVGGLRLSEGAIMDCTTAVALYDWTEKGVKPAIGRLGGGVVGLQVAAHYDCRGRNNQSGAKISEHGKGRAVDIAAIQLANGQSLTVLKGWNDPQHSKRLRAMHSAACGTFGTVLGPNSDGYHRDHLHLDMAAYRSGSYCK